MNEKTKRIGLLIKSLASVMVTGRLVRIPTHPKNILVIPSGKLGDVVCATPVLRALRAHYPQARIIVHDGRHMNEVLLSDSGLADEFIEIDAMSISELQKHSIDVALFTGPGFDLLAQAVLARIPCIVSPRVTGRRSPYETRPYQILSKFVITTPFDFYGYAPRERLRVLEPLDIMTSDTKKQLGFSEKARASVIRKLREVGISESDDFVCIAPGAGGKFKQWPPERFAEVATYIHAKHALPVLIIGSKLDREETDELFAVLPSKEGIVDMVEKVSIDELKAFIARAYFFIGVDTGPQYIAEAFDVPTINIVGPVYEKTQPAIGEYNLVVIPPGERKSLVYIMDTNIYDFDKTRAQVLAISVKQVTDAADALIQKLQSRYE